MPALPSNGDRTPRMRRSNSNPGRGSLAHLRCTPSAKRRVREQSASNAEYGEGRHGRPQAPRANTSLQPHRRPHPWRRPSDSGPGESRVSPPTLVLPREPRGLRHRECARCGSQGYPGSPSIDRRQHLYALRPLPVPRPNVSCGSQEHRQLVGCQPDPRERKEYPEPSPHGLVGCYRSKPCPNQCARYRSSSQSECQRHIHVAQ